MATINPTLQSRPLPDPSIGEGVVQTVTWTALTAANAVGGGVEINGRIADCVFQASGAFDGATLALEGSNDGVAWAPLTDSAGAAIALTAGGFAQPEARPVLARPATTGGGGGQDIDVVLAIRVGR